MWSINTPHPWKDLSEGFSPSRRHSTLWVMMLDLMDAKKSADHVHHRSVYLLLATLFHEENTIISNRERSVLISVLHNRVTVIQATENSFTVRLPFYPKVGAKQEEGERSQDRCYIWPPYTNHKWQLGSRLNQADYHKPPHCKRSQETAVSFRLGFASVCLFHF